MLRIIGAGALLLILIAGGAWFLQAPAPSVHLTEARPSTPQVSSGAPLLTTNSGLQAPQPIMPPAQPLTKRSDFLTVMPGDRVLLTGRRPMNNLEEYIVEIESVESPSGNLLIKGVVEGGGHFIATLGPTTLNVFLQSSNGTMRFSGANYTGELSALQMTNLADDVRLRVPAKMEQLESAIESPIQ